MDECGVSLYYGKNDIKHFSGLSPIFKLSSFFSCMHKNTHTRSYTHALTNTRTYTGCCTEKEKKERKKGSDESKNIKVPRAWKYHCTSNVCCKHKSLYTVQFNLSVHTRTELRVSWGWKVMSVMFPCSVHCVYVESIVQCLQSDNRSSAPTYHKREPQHFIFLSLSISLSIYLSIYLSLPVFLNSP